MTDPHTHILPFFDDGARDVQMSLDMLQMEQEQGVDTVILTPHCYRERETFAHFFERRSRALDLLNEAVSKYPKGLPRLISGAEVAWVPNLSEYSRLSELCIGGTKNLLLELPFYPWNDRLIHDLYNLINRGITPVFSHLERYIDMQREKYIREIIEMGMPVQVSCGPLLHLRGRRTALGLLKRHNAHLLGSDCHNTTTRRPNLKDGFLAVRRLLGGEAADELNENADKIWSE